MPTPKIIARYGWRKDSIDHRDFLQAKPSSTPAFVLPDSMDLRPFCPPVYDQGDLGSCTANAIGAAVDFDRMKQGEAFMAPSRLFIYYNEREIEGDTAADAGAEIRDGIKSVASAGVCPESLWVYSSDFTAKPTADCYTEALKYKVTQYASVSQDLYDIRYCLASTLRPVVFGFSVFSSFESDEVTATGIVPMPASGDTPMGGHAVLAVGYDTLGRFICRNSWGEGWGIKGYFLMPYNYLTNRNLASDFWAIKAGL
jgi:C1A family cysteine protease